VRVGFLILLEEAGHEVGAWSRSVLEPRQRRVPGWELRPGIVDGDGIPLEDRLPARRRRWRGILCEGRGNTMRRSDGGATGRDGKPQHVATRALEHRIDHGKGPSCWSVACERLDSRLPQEFSPNLPPFPRCRWPSALRTRI